MVYKRTMSVLNLRNVAPELMKKLKTLAAENGMTLREYVLKQLGDGPAPAKPAGETVGLVSEPPKISKPSAREGAVAEPKPQSTADETVGPVAAARKIVGLAKSDPEKIPGVKRGKHFTDTWDPQ